MNTVLKGTWLWELQNNGAYWLKLMATLTTPNGVPIPNKAIDIYKATIGGNFSFYQTKITDANGYIEYYFAGLTGTNIFNFIFVGDVNYSTASSQITVEYMKNPPTTGFPIVGAIVIAGILLFFAVRPK